MTITASDQAVTSIAVALLAVGFFLEGEQINTVSGMRFAAIYLANVLFSIPLQKEAERQFAFTRGREEYRFS